MVTIYKSRAAFQYLNGLINIFKPADKSINQVRGAVVANLCQDLNGMQIREPRGRVNIEKNVDDQNYEVKVAPDLADNVLVVGPRHQPDDFKCRPVIHMGRRTSGVLILGMNDGTKTAYHMSKNRPVRVYRVTGRFGKSTENHFTDSRVTTKHSFQHIYPEKMNRLLASIQASHQKKMFELCGVDIESQAAFELASKGPLRPANTSMPLIYGIKCVEFKLPYFTLEIHCANETEDYLGLMVNEIALDLKSVAYCTAIRCIRCGHFTLEDSILRHKWTLQGVLDSMAKSNQILSEYPSILYQENPALQELANG